MANAETMKFGPQWIRQLSDGGNVSTPPPTSVGSLGKFKLAEFRYSREEMLAFYNPPSEPPEYLEKFSEILVENCEQPLCLKPLSEAEQRLMNQGVNSTAVLRMMEKQSFRGGRGEGRGMGNSERGRGRGMRRGGGAGGGYVYLGDDDMDERDFERPRGRGRGYDSSRGNANYRGGYQSYGDSGPGEVSGGVQDDGGDWRRAHNHRPRHPSESEEDTNWRRRDNKPVPGHGGSGVRGSWRQRSNSGGDRGRHNYHTQRGGSRRHDDQNQQLPEWSTVGSGEDPRNLVPGSFDSSGSYISKHHRNHPSENVEDIWQEDWETEFEQNYIEDEDEYYDSSYVTTELGRSRSDETGQAGPEKSKIELQKQVSENATEANAWQDSSKLQKSLKEGPLVKQPGVDDHEAGIQDRLNWVDSLVTEKQHEQDRLPPEQNWFYKDPHGNEQGPFTDSAMKKWFTAGFFSPVLLIKRDCDEVYSHLGDYLKLFKRVPFIPGPTIPPLAMGTLPTPAPSTIQKAPSNNAVTPGGSSSSQQLTAPPSQPSPMVPSPVVTPGVGPGMQTGEQGDLLSAYLAAAQMTNSQQLMLMQLMQGNGNQCMQDPANISLLMQAVSQQQQTPDQMYSRQPMPVVGGVSVPNAQIPDPMINISSSMAVRPNSLNQPQMNTQMPGNVWDMRRREADFEEERRRKEEEMLRRESEIEAEREALGRQQAEFERLRLEDSEKMRHREKLEEEERQRLNQQSLNLQRQQQDERQRQEQLIQQQQIHEKFIEQQQRQHHQQLILQQQKMLLQHQKEVEEEERKKVAREQTALEEERRKAHETALKEEEKKRIRDEAEVRRLEEEKYQLAAKSKKMTQKEREKEQKQRQWTEAFKKKQEEEVERRKQAERAAMETYNTIDEVTMDPALEQKTAAQERAEQERLEAERKREQEKLSRLQLPQTARWARGSSGPQSSESAVPLTLIQKMQFEKEIQSQKEQQQARHMQQIQHQQQHAVGASHGGNSVWGWSSGGGKSLAQIQAEESEAQDQDNRRRGIPMGTSGGGSQPSPNGQWANKVKKSQVPSSQATPLATSTSKAKVPVTAAGASIWDLDSPIPTSETSKQPSGNRQSKNSRVQSNTSSGFHHQNSSSVSNSRANDDVAKLQRVFADNLPVDDLTLWCENALAGQDKQLDVDLPTLVEILRDIESPFEVEDYIKQYFGDSACTRQFIKDFLAKRREFKQGSGQLAAGSIAVGGTTSGSNGRAGGLTSTSKNNSNKTSTDQWQTQCKTGGTKKNKKKKMQKVNTGMLGFTCTSDPNRTNIGEIDRPE